MLTVVVHTAQHPANQEEEGLGLQRVDVVRPLPADTKDVDKLITRNIEDPRSTEFPEFPSLSDALVEDNKITALFKTASKLLYPVTWH